jgi:UDP-N-acetylglucosamine--N-acetylmuramyl-(pentapeptide) pyrophosphoryl-undecaprenol N-acetylglucosamine transferase
MILVIAGGGTGGHFFPALAVLSRAREKKLGTLFVGAERGIEKRQEGRIPGEKVFVEVYPLRGVGLSQRLRALKSYVQSSLRVSGKLPQDGATLLFGGYPSVPAGVSSLIRALPLFIHEQNSVPSMTNRTFSLFAKKVFITFEHTRRYFKGKHVVKTGLPVRNEILDSRISKDNARSAFDFESPPVVLFMGGSQGAKFLNTLAVDFARRTGANTILLSGEGDYERVAGLSKGIDNLRIFPFRTDMGLIYSAADVAVCRSGAGTLSELSLFGIPAVMIPYPYAAGDHQLWNALEIEKLGGGITVKQEEATTEKIISSVDRIITDHRRFSEGISLFASQNSAEMILEEILETLK